ncbi:hypothetical protein [Marivirga lumbricoides]|uniref:Secretion system C-terminal sorting domain-containing protein n=2 Tax=Marivirga lumbricoides TaxID=1046115 RepID=A0A2T4DIG9_9BACT|nr:hypothetical protein C9994_12905 [Marivirga lumbricoides]
MKKTRITNFAAVLMLTILPLMSFANGFPFVKLTKQENKNLTLRIAAIKSETIRITLKDDLGYMLFSEQVTDKNEVLKRFDLANLNAGNYKIEVENEMNVKVLPIKVTRTDIEIVETDFAVLYKPYIKMNEGGVFDFNLLNLDTEKTTVLILDDKGRVVFKDYLGAQSEYKKRYDISQLEKGNYSVIVNKGNRSFEKPIAH